MEDDPEGFASNPLYIYITPDGNVGIVVRDRTSDEIRDIFVIPRKEWETYNEYINQALEDFDNDRNTPHTNRRFRVH